MNHLLYSFILEIMAIHDATLSTTTGHQTHALFLDLVKQTDPTLSARLHNEPNYRPFTVSPLSGGQERRTTLCIKAGHIYRIRITLLDGGALWQDLSSHFLAAAGTTLRLDDAEFLLHYIQTTPTSDPNGWAGYTDWITLSNTKPRSSITIQFASPTAFSLSARNFALFPEPILLWDSLMRTWNLHAPEVLRIEKKALREFVQQYVKVNDYTLRTVTLHYPKYTQKGFVGHCTYHVKGLSHLNDGNKGEEHPCTQQLAVLAQFAQYAGVGYKTTMGMGQARLLETGAAEPTILREAQL